MNRRSYLGVVSAVGGTLVAGCTGGGEDCIEETALDEFQTFSAGQYRTWRFDMESGQELGIEAIRTGNGARPKLEVDDPSGNTIVAEGPAETIERSVTAHEDGSYYVRVVNEAAFTSGQWDITVTARSEGC